MNIDNHISYVCYTRQGAFCLAYIFGYFVPYAAALIVCIHTSRLDYTFSGIIIWFLIIILK